MSADSMPVEPGHAPTCPAPSARRPRDRHPVMVRVPDSILIRLDKAARRLGISRAALMLTAVVEKLERMEG